MSLTFGTRRQLVVFGVALAVFVTIFVRWRSAPDASGVKSNGQIASARTGSGGVDADRAASNPRPKPLQRTPSVDDISTVDVRDFDPLAPRSSGAPPRNIFDLRAPTPIPPPTPTPAPPPPPPPGSGGFIGPMPPPPPTPTPLPPTITFKFIGTFGPKDRPFAVLINGDQLINARVGDVVFEQFIVRRIGYESVDIGFSGRDPKDTRRLAIAP